MHQQALERRVEGLRSRRWTPDEARLVLDALEGSGETVPQFARRLKLDPQRLWWWRRRLGESTRREPPQEPTALAHFLPLIVKPQTALDAAPEAPAVLVSGGVRVEFRELSAASAAWAAALTKALAEGML